MNFGDFYQHYGFLFRIIDDFLALGSADLFADILHVTARYLRLHQFQILLYNFLLPSYFKIPPTRL